MITKLLIKNFKSIKETRLNCSKINIFIGPPNSGKSNILEVIGLLSYLGFGNVAAKYLRTNISRDLFYDKDISNEMKIETDNKKILGREEAGTVSWRIESESRKTTINNEPYNAPFPSIIGTFKEFQTFRFYRFDEPGTGDTPSEFLLPPDGSNLLGVILSNSKLRDVVGAFFEEFGYHLLLKPDEKKMEILKIKNGVGVSFNIKLVSETLLRMVFNFAIIMSNKDAIIALEEPESHAFPYYVKNLAESIALDKTNQFFITTHNPYFLIPIIEKAPKNDLNIFVTIYDNHVTKVYQVKEDKIPEILSQDIDIFFNLKKLIE